MYSLWDFELQCNLLPIADPHRRHPSVSVQPLHPVDQRSREAGPRGSEGVVDSNGPSVYVEYLIRDAEFMLTTERLTGKGFV